MPFHLVGFIASVVKAGALWAAHTDINMKGNRCTHPQVYATGGIPELRPILLLLETINFIGSIDEFRPRT